MAQVTPRDEQETVLVFDALTKQWRAWSTVPFHCERLSQIADIKSMETTDDGKIVVFDGWLAPSQIRFYDVPSEKQTEHMAMMRARRLAE
jgi:hypothetical protein